jgi:hypothetical protein
MGQASLTALLDLKILDVAQRWHAASDHRPAAQLGRQDPNNSNGCPKLVDAKTNPEKL